ncbi:HK97-gp10 family putative phage morphogenesis protein [Flexibacterium corallicola]|uniref:HK97-gp10 family putative phage morphogenesis protein n=1 Tax=Flexibacterium corallicola TaxID=3037259 RepID=UPI00286F23EC|nr:HK97-gp10 family putative phage morphogenesis protein [Pseudovibrio sp. M1P-2-3]
MADGIKLSNPNFKSSMARLRKIAPNLDKEVEKAQKRSAQEVAEYAKLNAPTGETGRLKNSIRAVNLREAKQEDFHKDDRVMSHSSSGWGIVMMFYWQFVEFGTAARHARKFRKSRKTQGNRSGTPARPFFWPAYRNVRKKHKGRMSRAMNKSIKDALKK